MKILILSCNTGGGHNSAAKALKEIFDVQGDECIIKDALSFGGQQLSDLVCDSYIEMVKHTPELFGHIYKLGQNLPESKLGLNSPVYNINAIYSRALAKYINSENFDRIICTHIFAGQALTHLKKHDKISVPFYFVATDYKACPMAEELRAELIFAPHEDSVYTFEAKGIPSKIIRPFGIPVSQKFLAPKDKETARRKLGFLPEDKIILIMTGSMGFGDSFDIVQGLLAKADKNTKIVLITGNNKKLFAKAQQNFGNDERLVLIGFTDQVSDYMDASDVLFSKPGGLSSTEAIAKGIPIVHTSPIPGCETENAEFFLAHHFSLCANTVADAVESGIRLLNDHFLTEQIIEAQKHYRPENAAKAIADCVKNS